MHLALLISLGLGTVVSAVAVFAVVQRRSRRQNSKQTPPGRMVIAANLASSRRQGRQRVS